MTYMYSSTISRSQVSAQHLAGAASTPADFISWNAQICSFVSTMDESIVRNISRDIAMGRIRLSFTSRVAWRTTQTECPDPQRVHAYVTQGTCPSKKDIDMRDVKRFLSVGTIVKDGLLVVKRDIRPEVDFFIFILYYTALHNWNESR